ncbi:MAG: SDR family oxidoreductase [Chloroherpetonaceae bacterium]|nr:SDR family oxidoreductase [Chloroherpetonaceae bacterium]
MEAESEKVCFITGAAGRLGRAMAIALAERGYSVCFTYRTSLLEARQTLKCLRKFAPKSQMVRCDVSKVRSLEHAFKFFERRFSRLDLCIANALNFFPTPLPEVTEKDWDSLVDTNLKGTFFTMQFAARLMQAQPFVSRIITMADVAADLVWRRYAPYTVSKAGVVHLTKVFAKEFAPKILVNAIAPGTILLHPDRDKQYEQDILQKIPLRRLGTPDDIVRTMLFLAESEYITGQVITVDGGRRLY